MSTLDEEGKLHQETLNRPDISFFKGRVQGNPDSKAFLAIGQHTTNGLITIGHDTFVVAQKQDTGEKIAYNLSNVNPDRMNWIDISCGVEEYVHTAYATEETSSRGIDEGGDCPTLRIAVDTDWDFTALFGGNTDASGEYAATLMGAMSTIYEEDVEFPVVDWTPAIAISSFIFYDSPEFAEWNGNIIAGTLRATDLLRMEVVDGKVVHTEVLLEDLARFRDIETGANGELYLLLEHKSGSQVIQLVPSD